MKRKSKHYCKAATIVELREAREAYDRRLELLDTIADVLETLNTIAENYETEHYKFEVSVKVHVKE